MSGPPARPSGSGDRLLWRTQWRLAAFTLALVAALVAVVGFATAVVAIQALESNVDRALEAAARAALQQFEGESPGGSAGSGEGGGDAGEGAGVGGEGMEHLPATADTFVVVFDSNGTALSNPSRVALAGYPDPRPAIESARASGSDLRNGSLAGARVRLLTLPLPAPDEGGTPTAYLQTGFVLALHEQQVASLTAAILGAALLGLIGAAIVTALVTARALAPIRRAFERERRFVADASHELRTPVAIVHASAKCSSARTWSRGPGRPLVDDILSETERVGRLVGDMLTLAASDAPASGTQKRPLDLGEVVADTVRRATPLARERGINLALDDLPARALPVSGDPDRLTQLLLALLDNAFGHSPPGGQVRVSAALAGRHATVSVSDRGPGVPAGERERIFEPFAPVIPARARRPGRDRPGAGDRPGDRRGARRHDRRGRCAGRRGALHRVAAAGPGLTGTRLPGGSGQDRSRRRARPGTSPRRRAAGDSPGARSARACRGSPCRCPYRRRRNPSRPPSGSWPASRGGRDRDGGSPGGCR